MHPDVARALGRLPGTPHLLVVVWLGVRLPLSTITRTLREWRVHRPLPACAATALRRIANRLR
jgi:hypothetical protein